jgi:DNA-binding NarL/FixJ family response regulator
VRVVVVEDDPVVAEGVAQVLRGTRFEVAARFGDAESALGALRRGLGADVALVDLGLPGLPGVELIRRLAGARPPVECVVLTVHDDDDHLFGALRAGATGYLLKSAPDGALVDGLEQLAAGGAPMSAGIARRVLRGLRAEAAPAPDAAPLTPREVEVLDLLSRGFTYASIGRGLGIACGTVQAHIKSIYRKLDVATKAEAATEGFRRGLLH